MKNLLFKALSLMISFNLYGTAQIPDILIYNGDTIPLFSCPLEYCPNPNLINPKRLFGSNGCFYTACYRNYIATWELTDNKLYLIQIRNACYPTNMDYVEVSYKEGADSIGNEYADLKSLFPEKFKNGKVIADWFNGTLLSPKGKLLYYIHDGFESIYEKEIEFTLEKGALIKVREFDNSKTRKSKYAQNPKLITEFIRNNIDYSNLPKSEDKIIVVVAVLGSNEEGKIDKVRILKGFNEVYDREAERVVKSIPEWDVLYRHGEKIFTPVWSIPVTFEWKEK